MPIYEYRCATGHTFEAFQPMADDPLTACEVCEAPVERLLSAPAVHFKGSGFYTTDYKRKGAGAAESNGESKGDSKSESKGDSKDKSKSDSPKKSESKPKSESKATD